MAHMTATESTVVDLAPGARATPSIGYAAAMVEQATALAMDQGFASVRDLLVVVAGIPFGHAGNTNNLRVVSIDR